MKITATKENLLLGVTAVQKAVSAKTTLPILSCIRLEAKENSLFFTGTDLELGIQCHVPVEVIEEGIIIVPARHFTEIVRKLPDHVITIEKTASNEVAIAYEESQLSLKTMSESEYPNIPEVQGEQGIKIKASVFKQIIRQTVFAAGVDEGRPLFTGILFEYEEDTLRLIATDTHRLALRQGKIDNNISDPSTCIVPAKILAELARLMHDDEETCEIIISKNLVSFKVANLLIISRLIDGQFPNYRQVIPETHNLRITVKNSKFKEAVERISLFTMLNDNSNTVHVKIEENMMVVSSQSEMGQGYEQISIEAHGVPVSISFNAKYLLDVFKVLEAEMVTVDFTGPLSPCIIRPAESDNYIYLLLPIRV